ncbi:MAG: AMMECR1 domain-containing protein [Capsulimonas sp.]|uniref:AMMECR1 domain-containing protein n=1 Tax=Capsulimonas sp. TaxID=2494211 RepID=UPI003265FD3E
MRTPHALPKTAIALFVLVAIQTIAHGAPLPSVPANATLDDPAARRYVLALARRAFDAYAATRTVIDPPSPVPAFLRGRSGVFVSTMMRNGAPRTCMGTLYPTQPTLAEEIIENAAASAGRDRRFKPVAMKELAGLNLIVSVVGTPRVISESAAARLDPVTDGLAVKYEDRYGVVLSGESPHRENMIAWGRARAGAKPNAAVEFFQIHDTRFMESQYK